MKKTIKITMVALIAMIVIFASLMFFVSSKINKEEIRNIIVQNIEKNLTGVKVVLGKLDYSLGLTVEFEIENLELIEEIGKNKLLSLKDLEAEIPLFALITSGGTIEIDADSPQLFVRKRNGVLNWEKVLPSSNVKETSDAKKSTVEIKLPSFIEKTKVNIKFEDIKVLYDDEGKKTNVEVSKFLIKNLNFKKSTAFEIRSKIKHMLDQVQEVSTDLKIIGNIHLKKLIEEGDLQSSIKILLENTKLNKDELPDLKGSVDLRKKEQRIHSDIKMSVGQAVESSLKAEIKGNLISINKLDLNILFSELMEEKFVKKLDLHKLIESKKFKVVVQGDVSFNMNDQTLKPNLEIKSLGKLLLNLNKKLKPSLQLEGKVEDKKIQLQVVSSLKGGTVETEVKTTLDPMNLPQKISQYNPVDIKMNVQDIKFSKAELQEMIYSSKNEETKENAEDSDINAKNYKLEIPKVSIELAGEKIQLGGSEISWNGLIQASEDRVAINKFDYFQDKGALKAKGEMRFLGKKINSTSKVVLNKISGKSFNAFLPPYLNNIEGFFSGNTDLEVTIGSTMKYEANVSVTATDGSLKGLNINKLLGPMFKDNELISKALGAKEVVVSNQYESLIFRGALASDLIKINQLKLIGHNKSSIIDSKGSVSMNESKSALIGGIQIASLDSELEKTFSTKVIPYRLAGNGFSLLPDLGYTTKELSAIRSKKIIKQEKKKIDKEVNKLKKKAKEDLENKAKSLLKGIKF